MDVPERGGDVMGQMGVSTRRGRVVDPDAMAAAGIVVAFTALVLSGFTSVSIVLVASSLVLMAMSAWRGLRTPIGGLAAATIGVWLGYGALIGSTPPLGEPAEIVRWAEHDGRFIWPFALIVGLAGLRRVRVFEVAVRVSWWLIVGSTAVSIAGGPWIERMWVDELLMGFTSSHHVMGALTMTGLLVLAGLSSIVLGRVTWTRRIVQVSVVLLLVVGLVLSGSRAAMLGLLAGLAVIGWSRLDRGTMLRLLVMSAVIVVVAFAAVPRLNSTARSVLSGDLVSRAAEAYRGRGEVVVATGDDSVAVRNIYIRFGLWGRAVDEITASPLVGAGAFRFNDEERGWSGRRGLVYVATSGENRFDDSQAHNTALQVAAETGLLGLVLFSAPFVIAWRQAGRTRLIDHGSQPISSAGAEPGARSGRLPGVGFEPGSLGSTARGFLLAGAAAGLVSEGVFSPNTGVPVAVLGVGAAWLASGAGAHLERHERGAEQQGEVSGERP